MIKIHLSILFIISLCLPLKAQLRLPAIIGDHMVIQQKQSNPIWGWDKPGTQVTVTFAGKSYTASAGPDGKWNILLSPSLANSTPQILSVNGTSSIDIQDVLVGEVWMCSGQSNMGFTLARDYNGDLESAASHLNNLRLIKVPQFGTQELQTNFKGNWKTATPESSAGFSAVGFIFGRYLHQILGVPVGLIDNAWGGSAAEAWIRRETLENEPKFRNLIETAKKREIALQSEKVKLQYENALKEWTEISIKAKAENKRVTAAPISPLSWLNGNARPGNIFAGVVYPTLGYGIKGVIWYQGEANTSRASEYTNLFPFLIEQWRKEWNQGDFPFYWVQLANFKNRKLTPSESDWAELREAQTKTLRLPNTGQAVIIDLGDGRNIHPRNKHDVAARLVRWALVKDYGMKLPYRSPEFKKLEITSNKAIATIDCFGASLLAFGVDDVQGFSICGTDRIWHWAKSQIISSDKVEIWSEEVKSPIAVRYGWADNPSCNLYSTNGLPLTPFRTDD
jgi:sialate O-acetylesterase